ncbi:MAG: translation initiation factor IF-3 [Candidatus Terrybacteria bacterium]|nr:translation initiation factor IF-3 [Candidatus Terrybacteria bacterium]
MIGPNGENFGVLKISEAIAKARETELDLIEIAPTAKPPVAKIMDYGKYLYQEEKKTRQAGKKSHEVETKSIQIGIGTSQHDLELRAKKIAEYFKEGNRVKIDLILKGREKYLDKNFLNERLNRLLHLIGENYKIADGPKKGPRGLTVIIEYVKNK